MTTTRQLAAIMYADIAGYTGFMESEKAKAIGHREKLKTKLEQLADAVGGCVQDFNGDGVLCYFNSTPGDVKAPSASEPTHQ